jgi:DNA-binding NarL/FixJ family response regulator
MGDSQRFEQLGLCVRHSLVHGVFGVLCAYDAAEAAWLCETYPVTHVIVDYDLGLEMSGPQIVQELKSIRPEIAKVVLCSGSPFDPATLPECIDAFVQKGDGERGLLKALRG